MFYGRDLVGSLTETYLNVIFGDTSLYDAAAQPGQSMVQPQGERNAGELLDILGGESLGRGHWVTRTDQAGLLTLPSVGIST